MISFVWAEDQKHQIGYKGHLPWRLPADLAHFKKVTMGHPMVMGKKTFDSFPGLLPGRKHVVLTHDTTLKEKYKDNSQVKILNSIEKLEEKNIELNKLAFSEELLTQTWENHEELQEEMRQDPLILASLCAKIEKGLEANQSRGGRR